MNLQNEINEIKLRLLDIKEKAEKEGREFTQSEMNEIQEKADRAAELDRRLIRAQKGDALLRSVAGVGVTERVGSGAANQTIKGLALTGRKGKAAAKTIAYNLASNHGSKAFVVSGSTITDEPIIGGITDLPHMPTSILEILHVERHSSPTWRYLRQTAFTNNAAPVAPGAKKPVSEMPIEEKHGKLVTFAHLSEYVDKYLIGDQADLSRFISDQLLYGLGVKVEGQILTGNGTGDNLTGLVNTSGIQTQSFATDTLTTLRMAMSKLESIGHNPDAIVIGINDWATIETTRTTSGTFDLGGPIDIAARKIWGTQVVTSPQMPTGTALILDESSARVDTDTQGIEIAWDSASGFDTNQVRARVEGRFNVSVLQPQGIVKANLTND